MDSERRDPTEWPCESVAGFSYFAGVRYWSASLLPALVGTTLPFWLRPPGFSFRWLGAIEFLLATVLLHAGFSFLEARFERRATAEWPGSRLFGAAGVCFGTAGLLGLHLTSSAPATLFLAFGFATVFAGVLYVAPPFSFCRRVGGEVVLAEGLGMLPVLGAYIIQAGDLTRTVYLASLPLVVATGLWVWTAELASREDDEKAGRDTIVLLFGSRFSRRVVVPALSLLLYAALFVAVFTASAPPLALAVLLALGLVWKIGAVSWDDSASRARRLEVSRNAFRLHLATCIMMAASPLVGLLR